MPRDKQASAQKWPLSKLKRHPKQSLFGDISDPEFEALVADIAKRGLQHPIEILPDGTIVAGHQRVRALRRLGKKEVDVIVRYDLEQAGSKAVDEHFLLDNLRRRQLSPLGRARCIQRLLDIQASDHPFGLRIPDKEKIKAQIGKELGLSGRSVNRYLLVLETPSAVQAAFDRGELTITEAGRVALLPIQDRDEIARRIDAGEVPKKVVTSFLRTYPKEEAYQAFFRILRAFSKDAPKLKGRTELVRSDILDENRPHLHAARQLIDELLTRKK
jgi:ParB/RepB/Spo0J family partition protein